MAQWPCRVLPALWLLAGCNSDVPVPAVARIAPSGAEITVTRVATHPFLARFNLTLMVKSGRDCVVTGDLFPDTGGVSRRNVYRGSADRLYVIGQFDVRRFDPHGCRIELIEFRTVESGLLYAGSFDIDVTGHWTFFPPEMRSERPFSPL
jgi:hypothetical protein